MAREDVDFVVCLGDYIYAESYHSRAAGPACATTRSARRTRRPVDRPRGADARRLPRQVRALPLRQGAAQASTRSSRWSDLGRPRGPGQLRRRRGRRRPAGGEALHAARRKGGLQGVLRVDAVLRRPARAGCTARCSSARTVDLIVMDQRQYRADQPCDDAVAPPCADCDQPRDFLGRTQMAWVKSRLARRRPPGRSSANEVMIMPTKVLGGSYYSFDTWQGYPPSARSCWRTSRQGIKDVVFVTGDIHTFIAGDVRTQAGAGESVALEFVGGSITSPCSARPTRTSAAARGRATTPTRTPTRRRRRAARHQPVGRPGRLRPPRLRRS